LFSVVDKLLFDNCYFISELERLVKAANADDKDIFRSIANLIARKPQLFTKPQIFAALNLHLLECQEEGEILQCIALIINNEHGLKLADDFDLISTLTSILLNEPKDENVKTFAVMALKK
jgi:hypothetical protein